MNVKGRYCIEKKFANDLQKAYKIVTTSTVHTVRLISMNPGLYGESILLIFLGSIWARDKPNNNFRSGGRFLLRER